MTTLETDSSFDPDEDLGGTFADVRETGDDAAFAAWAEAGPSTAS